MLILVKQSVKKLLDHLGLGAAFKLIKFAVFWLIFRLIFLGFAAVWWLEKFFKKLSQMADGPEMVMNPHGRIRNKSP